MTTPAGLLLWGQAGDYDAIEDRSVVATLAGNRRGLVFAPVLSARPGLSVGVGPWAAIVDCEDRTAAVIGSRETQAIDVPAGGGAARTDVLWADIDVDAGLWQGALYPASGIAGRAGVELGRIIVPGGANASSQFELIQGRVSRAGGADPARTDLAASATGTAWVTMFDAVIPGGDAENGSIYEIEVWGNGTHPTGNRRTLSFRLQVGAVDMNTFTFGTIAFSTSTGIFRWHAKGRAIRRATDWQGSCEATISMNENLSGGNTHHAFECQAAGSSVIDPSNDLPFRVQASWGPSGGGNAPELRARIGFYRKITGG